MQYSELFSVTIAHTYYDAGMCRDFSFRPTDACRTLLRDHGLLFVESKGGFSVLCRVTRGKDNKQYAFIPLAADMRLSFVLTAVNSRLLNFSELPLADNRDTVYWLSNLADNSQNGELLLSADKAAAFVSTKDRIALRPPFFQHATTLEQQTAPISVQDTFGQVLFIRTVPIADGSLPVDLNRQRSGRHLLVINGGEPFPFYCSSELSHGNAFAVIDIYNHDQVPEAYRFLSPAGEVLGRKYTCRIAGRRTFWKYYVGLKHDTSIKKEELSISYPGNTVGFTALDPKTLADGVQAVPFVADAALAMRETPVKGIKLLRKKGGGNGHGSGHNGQVPIVENLPNPSTASISRLQDDPNTYSEIFVYV